MHRQVLIKSLIPCEWQHQSASAHWSEFSQLSDFFTIKVYTRMEMHAVMISSALFFSTLSFYFLYRIVNNSSASPVCLLCLCTLFPNPQEAQGRRWRIKKGEEELRGENAAKTRRERRGRRREAVKAKRMWEGCIFTLLLFEEHFSTLRNYATSQKKMCYCIKTSFWKTTVWPQQQQLTNKL